jgi:two-component system OmpR family sensor kinase
VNRIFFRFFLLVMLSITLATFVIYFTISRLFGDPLEDIARRQSAAQIFLLEQYIDKAPADEWLVRLNKVREVSDVKLDLVPLAAARKALPARFHGALERGEVVLDVANKAFYRRVDLAGDKYIGSAEEVIVATELPIDIGLALQVEIVRYIIVALALLVPIALWSRSHWQGLQQLARVADEVGAGKLSARAHMKPSASNYPLAERINHMAGRIEGLLESQKSLVHSVSHELRTPIARLEFGLEMLRVKAADPALEQRIGAMEGDVAELKGLVDELLNMTRLDSRQALQLARFDLAAALQACLDSLDPMGPRPVLKLADGLGEIEGDQRLLVRSVCNVLRNAQKYAEGKIELSARRLGDTVEIIVDDDGPGIPAAERDKVFTPFYRLDRSRDRTTGGFGLGLSIAHKAVALHGGRIRIGDAALGGARFVLTLPVQAARDA